MRWILGVVMVAGCGGAPFVANGRPPATAIEHVVLVVQENHTFDNYFGSWCTAAAGSNPTCTTGPSCCEAAPATDPSGAAPIALDDAANGAYDPDHFSACETLEMNGGAMDQYATGNSCSDPRKVAVAPPAAVATYQGYATQYALADRYFQPVIGSSSANNMYFAVARWVFDDNDVKPDSVGADCTLPATKKTYTGVTTIADLLTAAGDTFATYQQGYAAMVAHPDCPDPPPDCPLHLDVTPCDMDPADNPFEFYAQLQDDPHMMKDYDDFARDLGDGRLPTFSFLKPVGYKSEHPGEKTTISAGEDQVSAMVDAIEATPYADNTLILIAWDEGGGYWDHVTPPADSVVDGKPYGTRVPMLAVGKFARAGAVSHVMLEHASIVKFIEWNFLGDTGQLRGRDTSAANLGSLLSATLAVPES